MRHLVIALLTFVPSTVLAHQEMEATLDGNLSEVAVGPKDCARTFRIDWKSNMNTLVACEPLQSWLTTAPKCGNRPADTDTIIDNVDPDPLPGNVGFFSLRVDALPVFGTPDAPLACPQADVQTSWRLCTSYLTSPNPETCEVDGGTTWAGNDHPILITWDSKPPAAPSFGSLTPLDGAAAVTVTGDADTSSVRVEARAEGLPTRTLVLTARPFTGRITELQNDTEYIVSAVATDAAGNESAASAEQTVRPVTTSGFWQNYKEAGGVEDGGCSHAGGGALAFLSLLSLARLVWRKRS